MVFVMLLFSCRKLTENNPSNATVEEAWTTPQGFITAVNAAYSEQRYWYGKEDGMFMGESGTDLWFNREKVNYANQLTRYQGYTPASSGTTRNVWRQMWKGVNQTNAGINRIDGAGFPTEEEKNMRLAELRFLRAFYYWHIVETWGGVMLRTTETQGPDLTAQRSPVEDFYDLILEDLNFAKEHLPNSWPNNEYSRATKKSAMGLLARAYLSRAYYSTGADATTYFTQARDVAKEVIDRKVEFGVDLWENYADIWLPSNNKRNKEALYTISNSANNVGLNYDPNGNRLHLWYLMQYSNKPGLQLSFEYGNDGQRRLMPTLSLLDYYNEELDSRYHGSFQEVWIANKPYTWTANDVNTYKKDPAIVGQVMEVGVDTALYVTKQRITDEATRPYVVIDRDSTYFASTTRAINGGNNFVALKKFHDPNRTAPNAQPGFNDIFVIRLAEMYLIAAEAEWKLGNNPAAADMINVLRTRAAIKAPVDRTAEMQVNAGDITRDFILEERARELAGEHLRWFDLKRMLSGEEFASFIKERNPDITAVQPYHRLRPVPQEEIDALLNGQEFGQNEGY